MRGGIVRSTGLEPVLPAASGPCLLPLGYKRIRAPDRNRTGDLRITSAPLLPTELRRHSWSTRLRT